MQTWIENDMVSLASHLVVHDMHMHVMAVAAVIVVRSSSDRSNASNEVRADISATAAGDMHGAPQTSLAQYPLPAGSVPKCRRQ